MGETQFALEFYETPSGNAPVREFLRALPKDVRSKIGQYLYLLECDGTMLPASYVKKVGAEIWELRPEYNGTEYRLFFGRSGDLFVLVHAIVKKRQQTPRADLDLAQRRFTEWRNMHDA